MIKLFVALLATVIVVSFSIANSHQVPLSLVLGAPVNVRLIFLLITTFFLGMAVPIIYRLNLNIKFQKIRKQENKKHQSIQRVEKDLMGGDLP